MEHVNGWCFRGIYKGGLWENDLHVSAHIHGLKMNIYTAAMFNITYGYIHGLKMNIYTAAVFKVAGLYTLLPFLHMKMAKYSHVICKPLCIVYNPFCFENGCRVYSHFT